MLKSNMENKNSLLLILILTLMALLWTSCHKDKDLENKEPKTSNVVVTPAATSASFSWTVEFAGQFQTGVELSRNENMTDLRRVEATRQEDRFVAVVDSLAEGTKYYYRIVVWNKFNRFEEEVNDFTTLETPPTPGQDTVYYDITVSVNLPEGGTAMGGGHFAEGDTCILMATANEGYVFVNWTENDILVDTNSVYAFVVTEDCDLVANFREEDAVLYTVIAKAEPEEGGLVIGGGTYEEGREVELKATENSGYTFVHWGDGSTDNPRTVTVTADITYTAYFNHDEYEIEVLCQPVDGGRAMGGGRFHYGDTITLGATPNANFTFAGWSDGSTDNPHEVVVTGPATYKAIFSEAGVVYYHVTTHAQPIEGGEVTGQGTYLEDTQVELEANPNEGYYFEKWDDGNTDNPRTITVNADMEFTAIFKKITYTVTVQTGIGGTAHIGDMTGTIEATFEHGESCTVHAIPETGYEFVNWTENGTEASTEENYSFEVTSGRNLVANFQRQQYWIGTSVNPANSGTVSGGNQYYNYGEQCDLTAAANNSEQYEFDHWTKNGVSYSGGASISFTVTEAATYTAHFRLKQYTISVSASPSNGGSAHVGSLTGPTSGTYNYGESCTVYATNVTGYHFVRWTENGNQVSNSATYTFTVTGNRTLVANFNVQPQAPTGAINGLFTINNSGGKVYFSQGNLQYIGSAGTPYWKFADNQWDYLGDNGQGSTSQTVDRDLFGWGTSGWNNGNVYYQPYDTQNNGNSSQGHGYGPTNGVSYTYGLTGTYANADWGVYRAISNGGVQAGLWRTLTKNEWIYIFNTRSASTVNGTTNARYAKAKVNNVQGVILFPDSYTHPSGVAQPLGINKTGNEGWNENNYSASDFGLMEQHGAVFLPAAGYRSGTSVSSVVNYGRYWSTSCNDSDYAYGVNFNDSSLSPQGLSMRYGGRSVRLVCPAEN